MIEDPCLNRAYRLKDWQDTLAMNGDWASTYDRTMKDYEYQLSKRSCGIVLINLLPYLMLVVALTCPAHLLPRRILLKLTYQIHPGNN